MRDKHNRKHKWIKGLLLLGTVLCTLSALLFIASLLST